MKIILPFIWLKGEQNGWEKGLLADCHSLPTSFPIYRMIKLELFWFWKMCLLLVCYVQMDGMIYLYVFWWHFYKFLLYVVSSHLGRSLYMKGKLWCELLAIIGKSSFVFICSLSRRWLIFLEFLFALVDFLESINGYLIGECSEQMCFLFFIPITGRARCWTGFICEGFTFILYHR